MIGGPNTTINNLASIYVSNNTAIAQAMARIASGKRVQVPSDDFAGYLKANSLQTDITGYTDIKAKLQDAKGLADYAKTTGNMIIEDFTKMKELEKQWAAANTANANDTDTLNGYKSKYDAIVGRIADLKADASYDGTVIYRAGVSLTTVKVSVENTSLAIDVQASAVANEAAGNVGDIAVTTADEIQNELNKADTYAAQMDSFSRGLQQQINLTDTVINSKEATISALTDINDVEEMTALTALQIRQEATVSMFAQANIIQGYAAKLYGGTNT